MKTKHNKKRNTAFVYEALIKEATVAILKNETDKHTKVVDLIKKYFNGDSILRKDLDCYRSLYENQNLSPETCARIITESKFRRKMITPDHLFKKQSEMISDINKEVDTEVFNNFVPNYKNLATIDQIFSGHLSPKRQVMLEAQLIDSMSAKQVDAGNPDQKTIDESTFKIFLNKFNDKYDSTLLNEQKELLGFYISSFSDNALELKVFLNEEITRLKTEISKAITDKAPTIDANMTDKAERILNKLEEFKLCQLEDSTLITIMKTQKLVKELNEDVNKD
tara:strand:- start:133 stop:972 length:840 start_codon:yes stop_codon:yes gene_type:complete